MQYKTIKLSVEAHKKLKLLAVSNDMTITSFITTLIDEAGSDKEELIVEKPTIPIQLSLSRLLFSCLFVSIAN